MTEILQILWFLGFVVSMWWVDQNERSRLLGVDMRGLLPEDAMALSLLSIALLGISLGVNP